MIAGGKGDVYVSIKVFRGVWVPSPSTPNREHEKRLAAIREEMAREKRAAAKWLKAQRQQEAAAVAASKARRLAAHKKPTPGVMTQRQIARAERWERIRAAQAARLGARLDAEAVLRIEQDD